MRKMFKTLVFGVIIATPLLLAPHKSQAGIIKDILEAIFGKNDNDNNQGNHYGKDNNPGNHYGNDKDKKSSASVPLNEGQILLIVAGLGLGAKMLYDRHGKQTTNSVI